MDQPDSDKQCPNYILMIWVNWTCTVHQVERYLRNYCEQKQPQYISAQISCMEVSLDYHKGKNRIGQTSQASEPLIAGNHSCPKVIAQHERHGEDMQRCRADVNMSFVFHIFPLFMFLKLRQITTKMH